MGLEGKIALVTGASRGIGAAILEQLSARGATVVGTATSESGAAGIDERIASIGGQGGGMVAMGDRDAGVGRGGDRSGHARHHLEWLAIPFSLELAHHLFARHGIGRVSGCR